MANVVFPKILYVVPAHVFLKIPKDCFDGVMYCSVKHVSHGALKAELIDELLGTYRLDTGEVMYGAEYEPEYGMWAMFEREMYLRYKKPEAA
jgi:hypothetical protein